MWKRVSLRQTFVSSSMRMTWVWEVVVQRSMVMSNSGVRWWWRPRRTSSVVITASRRAVTGTAHRRRLQVRRVVESAVVNIKPPRRWRPTRLHRVLSHPFRHTDTDIQTETHAHTHIHWVKHISQRHFLEDDSVLLRRISCMFHHSVCQLSVIVLFPSLCGHTLKHTAGGYPVIPFTTGLPPASEDIPLPQIISWCCMTGRLRFRGLSNGLLLF